MFFQTNYRLLLGKKHVLNKVSYNLVLQFVATYLLHVLQIMIFFHITSNHDYVMSKPFASKIPPCPDTQHTHCLLAQTLSVKFLKATCQTAAFDENNLPYIRTYIHTYIHTLDQRVATLYFFVPWVRPRAPQETLVSMLRQKSSNFTAETH